ncbi:composite domain of metallo-dependent hydrolase [Exidia glandulosa HHB12029]|uniref:Composite domain of metallo-dependent hydrolase n=1 Tax=Exidia glandulosa HHB12029 TaxID=1314781 RepID=A0A165MDZ8_EXIGL|nr:composite domain of metallo-dependent hydrolase [Exidia glandulosa HHB12029]
MGKAQVIDIGQPQRTGRRTVGVLAVAALAAYALLRVPSSAPEATRNAAAPADEWQDNVFPFRQPTPWDISTDFPTPRKLDYEVTEGTWMRLDVHPVSGEIVFDMLGDIYCLAPPSTTAHPVLLGVPHDVDPRFSPSGDRLAFRSDAELGLDNIWVIPWTGCEDMSVRSGRADFAPVLAMQDEDEKLLAAGARETDERRERRLLREGRLKAHRVTNETYRFITHPRWHPSGDSVAVSKWFFGTRSIAGPEAWQVPVPSKPTTLKPGVGKRLLSKDLPIGWSAEQYGEQQVGPEQAIWAGNNSLIYAKNVIDRNGVFQYSKDIHNGIYAIFQRNLTTGRTTQLVSNSPGGASRPELSRDGKTLAFVRRVRDKEALVLYDMQSGTLTHIWYGLTYDLTTIYAPMGTYPSFAWTPADDAIIIWAAGHIWRVPIALNALGEKVGGGEPQQIPFVAKIEKRIAETLRPKTDLRPVETAHEQRLYAFRELSVNDRGDIVVFNAAGATYVQNLPATEHEAMKMPVLHPEADYAYYSPSFIPHQWDLVIHARWHDTRFSSFEISSAATGHAIELTGLPLGRYYAPTVCECTGNKRRIAFVRTPGTVATGNIVATANLGLYIGDIELPTDSDFTATKSIEITNVRLVSSEITSSPLRLKFQDGARKLLVQNEDRVFTIDLTKEDSFGEYSQTAIASGRMASEVALSDSHFAFVERMQVYLALVEDIGSQGAWAKPGNATKDVARLSLDGGHDLAFSHSGQFLFWFLGPYLHSVEVKKLNDCMRAVREDKKTFGIDCVKGLLEVHEIHVKYESSNPNPDDGVLVVKNATLVTMDTGNLRSDVIEQGTLVVQGGVIHAVGSDGEVDVPSNATVIDAQGGVVLPGFLDIHAHSVGHFQQPFDLPARDWQHVAALAYGVTTLHNPSWENVGGFVERAFVERGRMIGPRIYHTGGVIYGAEIPDLHQEIVDMDEARAALIRIKAEGGPSSFSYKNYQLPSRAARQRLLLMARNLSMICVPEGGMNFDWDLTYIADGMTTVEHSIPVPQLYEDVLTFFAKSGTANTPTHIVNYGGTMGQELLWATTDIPNHEKLRKFVPHDDLELVTETTSRPWHSFAFFNTSASLAQVVARGGLANIGAHGQPPMGLMYHTEMAFFESGGFTPYEVLKAATRMGAESIGVFDSLGSLSKGKLADFVVYPPGNDVVHDLSESGAIRYVARGGRVWQADTMAEVWPNKGQPQVMPPFNAD